MDESRQPGSGSGDPYARSEYRRLIAWESRIRREGTFLTRLLAEAPEPSVVDLGCGTGEHTAFFAREGARAVGLDRSESMLERAREHEARGEGRFVLGEIPRAANVLAGEPRFGLAICLGNTLPHLLEESELRATFEAVERLLLPGGKFLLQILNYRRILDQGVRHLPINVRPGDDGREIVFLRLMKPVSEERLLFFPTTLELDPDDETPVTLKQSRRVELRPWTRRELVPIAEALGFSVCLHGDMEGGPYRDGDSADLVLVVTKP